MVVIQENKTYFLSSMLHLPHGVGEVEPTATFRHITYVNINGVSGNGRLQRTLNFLYQIWLATCSLRRNGWSQFVGVLIAK
jgi:hypothetical protein